MTGGSRRLQVTGYRSQDTGYSEDEEGTGPGTGHRLEGTGDRKEKPIAQVEAHPELLNPAPMVKHYKVVVSASARGKQGT